MVRAKVAGTIEASITGYGTKLDFSSGLTLPTAA